MRRNPLIQLFNPSKKGLESQVPADLLRLICSCFGFKDRRKLAEVSRTSRAIIQHLEDNIHHFPKLAISDFIEISNLLPLQEIKAAAQRVTTREITGSELTLHSSLGGDAKSDNPLGELCDLLAKDSSSTATRAFLQPKNLIIFGVLLLAATAYFVFFKDAKNHPWLTSGIALAPFGYGFYIFALGVFELLLGLKNEDLKKQKKPITQKIVSQFLEEFKRKKQKTSTETLFYLIDRHNALFRQIPESSRQESKLEPVPAPATLALSIVQAQQTKSAFKLKPE